MDEIKKNSDHHFDIVINGAGMIGLTLSLALARKQFKIAIIENHLLNLSKQESPLCDPRVSAINIATLNILQHLKIWQALPVTAYSDLNQLIAWDNIGGAEISFSAEELGEKHLGAIVENRALIQTLWQALQQEQTATIICPQHPIALEKKSNHLEIYLNSEKHEQINQSISINHFNKITTQLLIGADGINSWVRQQMGIAVKEQSYQQQALIAIVKTEKEHHHTGWQAFIADGTVALLPLSDPHQCALIWSIAETRANTILQMNEAAQNRELNNDFGLRLHQLKLLSPLQAITLKSQQAEQFVMERMALVGDAVHRIHPLAGQGANLGFMDLAVLYDRILLEKNNPRKIKDFGKWSLLKSYERARKLDHFMVQTMMDFFNKGFTSQSSLIIQALNLGLQYANKIDFIKKLFIKGAEGRCGEIPSLTFPE